MSWSIHTSSITKFNIKRILFENNSGDCTKARPTLIYGNPGLFLSKDDIDQKGKKNKSIPLWLERFNPIDIVWWLETNFAKHDGIDFSPLLIDVAPCSNKPKATLLYLWSKNLIKRPLKKNSWVLRPCNLLPYRISCALRLLK